MYARNVNKDHPDYPVYIEKCKKLWEFYGKKIADEEAKHSEYRGKDSPASETMRALDQERNEELRKLQKEYSHLFAEE